MRGPSLPLGGVRGKKKREPAAWLWYPAPCTRVSVQSPSSTPDGQRTTAPPLAQSHRAIHHFLAMQEDPPPPLPSGPSVPFPRLVILALLHSRRPRVRAGAGCLSTNGLTRRRKGRNVGMEWSRPKQASAILFWSSSRILLSLALHSVPPLTRPVENCSRRGEGGGDAVSLTSMANAALQPCHRGSFQLSGLPDGGCCIPCLLARVGHQQDPGPEPRALAWHDGFLPLTACPYIVGAAHFAAIAFVKARARIGLAK